MARPRRAGSPNLSRDQIALAALECLDAEGFAAFSLRAVARRLDVFPGALYWHFPAGREALLAAAAGAAVRDVTPPAVLGQPWQDWLRALFHNYRAAVRAHPSVAGVLGSQLLSNTAIDFDLVEGMLAALSAAGFRDQGLVRAYNAAIAAVVGFTTLEFAPLPAEDPAAWQAAQRNRLASLDPARHPHTAATLPALMNRAFITRWENGIEVPLDDSFVAFVEIVIAGLERG